MEIREVADYSDLDSKVSQLGKQTIRMCTEAGSGHPSSGLSLVHLVTALMYRVMRYDPANPWHTGADRLVLSEGHAVPVVYAAYCDLAGVVGEPERPSELRFEDALSLRAADSVLDGHPNPAIGFPFFDSATGSLGQGLSSAAGLAAAARLDKIDRRIFCIIGDGEAREGQVWEAVDFIVDHKLTACRAIFNANGQAQSDYVSPQQSAETLAAKLTAYGMDVRTIDGHNWDEVFEALSAEPGEKPIAIVAKTVKGWGVEEFQQSNYHGKPLKTEQVEQALADLGDLPDVRAEQIPDPPSGPDSMEVGDFSAGTLSEAAEAVGLAENLAAGKLSTRRAYGAALNALGADPRVVALDGDVKNSTFAEWFAQNHSARYFEARIAEQNMVSAAVGLAAGGKVPFVSSFGKFFARAFDQIDMAAITCANIKMCGSHAGVSLAADGPSQMAVSDLAFFRAQAHARRPDGAPACRVLLPSDAVSAFKLTELAANIDGMCYLRTHRPDVPVIYSEEEDFPFGRYKHLFDGEDVAIVTSGYMVHVVRAAAAALEEKAGLSASIVDVYSLPLNEQSLREIIQIGDDCRGQLLVVEDNYAGGVYDEIAAAAARSDLGVRVEGQVLTTIPKSARTPEETLALVQLGVDDIVSACQRMFDESE
jgi:transketolase